MTEEKNTKSYSEIKMGKEKDSMLEFTGLITPETLERHKQRVVQELQREFEAPGFRKGRAPEDIVLKSTNPSHLLEEAANSALREIYPRIVEDYDLEAITPPEVTVTKLAFGSPLEFKIRVGIQPKFKLPDYKGIAKKVMRKENEKIEISDAQVEELVKELQELRVSKGDAPSELTDEYVKSLGAFDSVDDFKAKMKENLALEKELDERKKKREDIAKELAAASKFSVPSALVEIELVATRDSLYDEINKNQLSKEEYFTRIGKTEEEFLNVQRESIVRQFKTKMILDAIAKEEHIEPTEEELHADGAAGSIRYPDIDPTTLLRYVSEMLRNEKALQFLEEQGKEGK